MNKKLISLMNNISLFLISAAILSYEISLMRILKIEGFGNFTFLAIGIALTGFGMSGTMLLAFRKKVSNFSNRNIVMLYANIGFAAFLTLSHFISQYVHFDPLHLFWDKKQVFYLSIRLFLYVFPFISGSFAVMISFLAEKSTKVYFFNMTGSGIGILLTVVLFWYLDIKNILLLPLSLSLFALTFVLSYKLTLLKISMFIIFSLACIIAILKIDIYILPYRDIKRIFNFPDSKIIFKKNSPYGTLTVVHSSMIRYAPGLSLTFQGSLPEQNALLIDGDIYSTVDLTKNFNYLNYQIQSIPYKIKYKPSILVYPLAGGQPIVRGFINGAKEVLSVCENPLIVDYVKKEFLNNFKKLKPSTKILKTSPGLFLNVSNKKFDIIEIALADIQASPLGGIYSQEVNYSLTVEAFREYINRLKPDGILSISINIKYPPRSILKITSTLLAAYKDVDYKRKKNSSSKSPFNKHLFIARGMDVALLIFKKSELKLTDISKLKNRCRRLSFDLIYYPGIKEEESNRFFIIKNNTYYKNILQLITNPSDFEYSYIFNIFPATDNNPYFYNFIKIKNIPYLFKEMGKNWFYLIESFNFINFISFAVISIISLLLIFFPLNFANLYLMKDTKGKTKLFLIFIYFSFIGIGYMTIEVVLIEMIKKFYDNPVISSSVILASLLTFSGLGSLSIEKIAGNINSVKIKKGIFFISLLIAFYLLIILKFLTPVQNQVLAIPVYIRVFITILFIAPAAFLMGMPFPIGVSILKQKSTGSTIWAWSINGYFSVIASTGINLILPIYGFKLLLITSLFLYFIVGISSRFITKE